MPPEDRDVFRLDATDVQIMEELNDKLEDVDRELLEDCEDFTEHPAEDALSMASHVHLIRAIHLARKSAELRGRQARFSRFVVIAAQHWETHEETEG